MDYTSHNILKCKLCCDFMRQPKILENCKDSFCLSCLKNYCGNKSPGSRIVCPSQVCTQTFTIPKGGVDNLQNNIFVAKSLLFLNTMDNPHFEPCNIHASDYMDVFCETCKKGACKSCLIEHSGHRFHKLEDARKNMTREIMTNVVETEEFGISLKKCLMEVDSNIQEFDSQIDKLESAITNKSTELKKKIDDEVSELLSSLMSYKEQIQGKNRLIKAEIENKKLEIETLLKGYENALSDKSLLKAIYSINEMMPQLKKSCESKPNKITIKCKMTFLPENTNSHLTVGKLAIEDSEKDIRSKEPMKLTTYQKLPDEFDVRICLTYGKRLFCIPSILNEIHIYERETFKLERRIEIRELRRPTSMAATCNCLFVCNSCESGVDVLRVDLFKCKVSLKWSAPGHSGKISLTEDDSILLCTSDPNMLAEYSLEGKMQNHFKLDTLCNPQHALKIRNKFIVCSNGSNNVLVVVDCYGKELKAFEGSRYGLVPELCFPCHLLKNENSDILVLDSPNSRVVAFRDNLEFIREICFDSGIFCDKTNGSLDEANKLYLSNTIDDCVYIFDLQEVPAKF